MLYKIKIIYKELQLFVVQNETTMSSKCIMNDLYSTYI